MTNSRNIFSQAVLMDDLGADDEFITAGEFEDATRTVVRTIGRNHDLEVVFAGDGAHTDGKLVCLPTQDSSKTMTKKQYAVGQGYANHETLHNLCTDIKGMASIRERLHKEGKKLAMACSQAIEDIRIERAGAVLYPGIPNQIASTADYVNKEFLEGPYAEDPSIIEEFKRIGPLAITWRGRQRMGYGSPYIDKCLALLKPEQLKILDKWIDMVEGLDTGAIGAGDLDRERSFKGSIEGIKLAELIAKDIDDIDDSDDDSDGDAADGEGGGQASTGTDLEVDPYNPDMRDAVLKLMYEGTPEGTRYRTVSTALDRVWTRDTAKDNESVKMRLMRDDGNRLYQAALSELGSRTATMKRKLERALLTACAEDYVTGQRTGKLDITRKAVSIFNRKENVHRKKVDGKNIDTAVTILVDISGSMSGEKMQLAAKSCTALAECFEKTPVDLEILCFSSGAISGAYQEHIKKAVKDAEDHIRKTSKNPAKDGWHRCEPMNIWVIKDFSDSLRVAKQSLGSMQVIASGNNPDGDAILYAAQRLKRKSANKHILLVLSDGQPHYGTIEGDWSRMKDYTKRATDYVTKMGVNLVGIGIMDDTVKQFYKNYAVVNDLEDLSKNVMDKVAKLIIGEDFKVDNGDLSSVKHNATALKRTASGRSGW